MASTGTAWHDNTAVAATLEAVRRAAAVAVGGMGVDPATVPLGSPKIAVVFPPVAAPTLRPGVAVAASDGDVTVRCLSAGAVHRAMPLTAALCTGVAAQIPGTIVRQQTGATDDALTAVSSSSGARAVRILNPSGALQVSATVAPPARAGGPPAVVDASVVRTQRRLFSGQVHLE